MSALHLRQLSFLPFRLVVIIILFIISQILTLKKLLQIGDHGVATDYIMKAMLTGKVFSNMFNNFCNIYIYQFYIK